MGACHLILSSQALLNNEAAIRTSLAMNPSPRRECAFFKSDWVDDEELAPNMQMGLEGPTSNSSVEGNGDPRRNVGQELGVTVDTLSRLCQHGQLVEAVEALEVLVQTDPRISRSPFYAVVKACVDKKDLVLGRRVHALIVQSGYESDTFLCNHILRMYASRGRLQEAMEVFSVVAEPDAFMWSSIISAHVRHGQPKRAIHLYQQMRRSDVKPDGHVFVAALQACARAGDLKTGQEVHADLWASGVELDLFVGNCLVDMYAKVGSLSEAHKVFLSLVRKDVVTWNAMLTGYSQQGLGEKALHLYSAMQQEGIAAPDSVTFVCLLQACASMGILALEEGKRLHAEIRERGLEGDVTVINNLINMYAKCGSLKDAHGLFKRCVKKDVVTWTTLIAGYSQQGMCQEALRVYGAMQQEGITAPDSVTFICLLQACASVGASALKVGKLLHSQIRKQAIQVDVVLGCSMVTMYARCGSLVDAQSVFDTLPEKDGVTWNAMIAGYSQQGMGQEALCLYSAMQCEGIVPPDSVTFVCLLQACASVGALALETGKQLHEQIRERALESDGVVGCSMVNMYAKCGSLQSAQRVFDGLHQKDVVAWTTLIAGYSQQGVDHEALRLYSAMQQEGIIPTDCLTFVCLLQACANAAALQAGRLLHSQIEEQGLQSDVTVGNSLINMYAKSGSMGDAKQVFDALPERDVVTWNALIAGYTRQGDSEAVFDLVHRMKEDGTAPDSITFLSVLTACSHVGLVNKGQEYFKAMSCHYGITATTEHYSCMVDLLGRAGLLHEALLVVQTMPAQPHNAVWHTLLGACQKWSNVEVGRRAFAEAIKLDEKDAAAYVSMSNIYSSAQMWEEAQEMQERRKDIGARKQRGRSWWTDLDGLVHSFVVGDTPRSEP